MPCRSDDWDGYNPPGENIKQQLDKVSRIACEAMKRIEESGTVSFLSTEAQDWYKAHKLADARRREENKTKATSLRKQAEKLILQAQELEAD